MSGQINLLPRAHLAAVIARPIGIPLDEIGATGFGLVCAIDVAAREIGLDLKGARVAVQGFGSVGKHAARFLAAKGAILVAASDTHGTIAAADGLDTAALLALKAKGRPLKDHPGGKALAQDAVIDIPCDIWIPAARPDVITAANVDRLKTRLVAQGANVPVTEEAEQMHAARGVLVLPDFIANAGGVICAAVEYRHGTRAQALAIIDERIRSNIQAVLDEARRTGALPRAVAMSLAVARVRRAMQTHIFHAILLWPITKDMTARWTSSEASLMVLVVSAQLRIKEYPRPSLWRVGGRR
ncbi:MAG: hypothetical protein HYX38_34675 [Rhodospirillales bacterium]|nr:hypothetical protein [Rhodospirillales bacterium]